MNFVSYKQLNEWILEFIKTIPNKFDLIVGIPRCGLVFASILSAKFGRPLTVPDSYWMWKSPLPNLGINSILICDDAISSGQQMDMAIKMIHIRYPNAKIEIAVVIKHLNSVVDYYHKITDDPKLFEWSLVHFKSGKLACDIDGVICNDLPVGFEEEISPEGYEDHIKNAIPQFIPQYTIDTIVSCRVERWRKETEKWLQKVGIKYEQLKLWDIEKPANRIGKWADYKIEEIGNANIDYVFESNWEQTQRIYEALKIPVLCFEKMEMLGANND